MAKEKYYCLNKVPKLKQFCLSQIEEDSDEFAKDLT